MTKYYAVICERTIKRDRLGGPDRLVFLQIVPCDRFPMLGKFRYRDAQAISILIRKVGEYRSRGTGLDKVRVTNDAISQAKAWGIKASNIHHEKNIHYLDFLKPFADVDL